MAFFIMEYRVKGCSLSDGFRRDPKWGKKTFTVSSTEIGTEDIEVVRAIAASPEATPAGYHLFSVHDRDAETAPNRPTTSN
ncbi:MULTISPECIES: hypothetical protein [unclassified Pseudomonas]|uniref:hypothetical protein n=1 Tax=unclassified Pseudomonas TaxID=196821 RepID=UPI000BE3DE32|nr:MULTISPECIES: hypothetical protein [unclassified Pseudomonas]